MKAIKETILHPFQLQKKQTLIFLSVLMLIMIAAVTCGFTTTKNVKIIYDTNKANDRNPEKTRVVSAKLFDTAEDVLREANITVDEDKYVDVDLNSPIKDIDAIHIVQKIKGVIVADGKEIPFSSAAARISDVLSEHHVYLNPLDEVSPQKGTFLSTKVTTIKVTRVERKTVGSQIEIPHETVRQENAELTTDVQNVITPGKNGLEARVEMVTYRDGVESEKQVLYRALLTAPVAEVVEFGTKLPGGSHITGGHATIDPGSEMDFICAVVAQEGGHSYEGALAVISCIMNRADAGNWGGSDPISVITSPGQFSAYLDGDYQKYMGAELPEVRRAVTDCMVNGVRSHSYTRFRGYEVDGGVNICGNYYF